MDTNVIRDKIKKLLALSASSNEAEAKAALMKAHELMGRYKLSIVELEDKKDATVIVLDSGLTATKITGTYMFRLAHVIAEACLCRSVLSRVKGDKTYSLRIAGFEDDAIICKDMFSFVASFLKRQVDKQTRYYTQRGVSAKEKRAIIDGYTLGFVAGLKENLDKQKDTSEWGLVMVEPSEVKDFVEANFKGRTTTNGKVIDNDSYARGVKDGKDFNVMGYSNKKISCA